MALYTNRQQVDFPYIAIKFKDTEEYIVSGKDTCFISLTHKRKVEKANQVEIHLQFAPGSTQLYTEADRFEKSLVGHASELIFDYGYVNTSHLSYETLITDYTLSMNGGFLEYTLSGISEITASNYTPVNFIYPLEDEESTKSIKNLVARLNTIVETEYNQVIEQNQDNQLGLRTTYTVVLDENVDESQFNLNGIDSMTPINVSDTSLMGLIRAVIKKINASQDPSQVTFLTVYLQEDSDINPKKIVIKQEEFSVGSSENFAAKYEFYWNHRDGNVLSWSPSYSGKVAIFGFRNQEVSYLNPYTGGYQSYSPKIYMPTVPQNVSEAEADSAYNRLENWWAEMKRLPYKATLEVIGNPDIDCLLADYIKVQAYLGTDLHHSSGIYMITGITDTISTQGFLTSYELLKRDAIKEEVWVPVSAKSTLTSTAPVIKTDGMPERPALSNTTKPQTRYKQAGVTSKYTNKGVSDIERIN